MRRRALIIDNSRGITGALKAVATVADKLDQSYEFVFVMPTGSKGIPWLKQRGFDQIIELPMHELSKHWSAIFTYFPFLLINAIRLKKISKRYKIDLIHSNDIYNMLPVVLSLTGSRLPYVCHVRFLPNRFPGFLMKVWLRLHFRFAHSVVAVSNAVVKLLPNHPKVIQIYDPIPLLTPSSPVQEKSARSLFLYLANFTPGKGHEIALKAFANIHEAVPFWKIRFVGGDLGLKKNSLYQVSLETLAKSLNIADKVEWAGVTEDVVTEYIKADIVLNFSESESLSMTCLEALSLGKPVIATKSGGPEEIIENGKTGILVESPESIERAMLCLASNKELQNQLGEKGRASVRHQFSHENTSYHIGDIYTKLLNPRR